MSNVKCEIKGLYFKKLHGVQEEIHKYKLSDAEVEIEVGDLTVVTTSVATQKFSRETLEMLSEVIVIMEKELEESVK